MRLFLDDHSGATLAYGYKLLRAGYTGSAIRIRRANDNAETDIGFVGGYLDTAAVEAFVPASGLSIYVYLVRFYDQTGNGNDATQTVASYQPLVGRRLSGGGFLFFSFGSSPRLTGALFNGVRTMNLPSIYSQSAGFTTLYHVLFTNTTTQQAIFNLGNATEKFSHNIAYSSISGVLSAQHVSTGGFNDTAHVAGVTTVTDYGVTDYLTAGPTTQYFYLDETNYNGTIPAVNSYNQNILGGETSTSNRLQGYMQAFVVFATDKYSSATDMNAYWQGLRPPVWYFISDEPTTGAPTVGSPSASIILGLTANGITTGAPTLGSPTLQSIALLTANNITTGLPTLGSPTIAVTNVLTALSITTGTPFVGSASAIITRGLTANGITTPAPRMGKPQVFLGTFNINLRALSTFTSELGREWKLSIIEKGFAGPSLTLFELAAPGFTISYESPNDDLITPIKASKCSAELIIQQTDTAMQTLITDIAQADDGVFYILIEEDKTLTGVYEPYWWGPIYNDMIKEPDTWPSVIKLVATDSLGRLKDIDYEDALGNPVTGNKTFTEIIAENLEAGGNGTDIVSTDYIKFSTEWWHNEMGATINNEPMALSAVRAENYWERDDDTGKYVAPVSFDVLESILNDWNARIIMADGYYVIEQASTYSAINRNEYITDDQGAITSSVYRDTSKVVDQTNVIQLADGKTDWNKSLKEVKRIYSHRYASNILNPQEDYWEATNSATFPYGAQPMNFGTAGVNKSLKIDGSVEIAITNNTGSDYAWSTNHVMLSMRVSISNGTTTYYLNKAIWDAESNAQWITSTGGRYDAAIPIGKLNDGEQFRKVINFTVQTPSWTEEGMLGTLFYVQFPPTPAIYVAATATGNAIVNANKQDFDIDPYDAAFSGDTVLQGRTEYIFIGLTGGNQNEEGEEIEYIATNSSGTGVNEYEYENASRIGSFYKSQIEPGLIRVWDGSQYVTDLGEWEYAAISGAKDFNNLAVQERLRMNAEPRDRKYITIFGHINATDHLQYGTGPSAERYVFLGGEFIANNDRWRGAWEKITRATTGITGSGSNLPTPAGISGVVTGPTLPNAPTLGGLLNGSTQQNALTQVTTNIPKNTSISNIPIGAFWKSGVINSGDIFTVMDNSGQVQNFTASAHVGLGDTSISVTPKTTTAPIGAGSTIFFNAQQQGTAITNFHSLPITTTSTLVITPTSGTISGSGTITEMRFGGLVYCTISWKSSSVSSPTGQVHITGFANNLPSLGTYFMVIGSGWAAASLPDGPSPSIVTSSGLRLLDHELGSNIGAFFTAGTDIDGTFVFPYTP